MTPPPSNYQEEKEKIKEIVKLIEGTIKHLEKIADALPRRPDHLEWDRLHKELTGEISDLKKEVRRLKDYSRIVFE